MKSLLICVLLICAYATAQRWDTSMLQSFPTVQNNASVEHIVGLKKLEQLDWGCLFNTDKPGHSKNKWHEIDTNRSEALKNPDFLRGTTFWINEYMSVGHMMYDIALLQTLQTVPIDRIILQRAVCISANQCAGIGMFESFFKGMYTAMINAYHKEIPIFLRWSWQAREMKPLYLSDTVHNNEYTPPIERRHRSFHLKSVTCMERVIRNPMRCTSCFHNSVSPTAAARFKEVAYTLVTPQSISEVPYKPLVHHFAKNTAVVVTLAHRGLSATRHMANIPHMAHILGAHFAAPEYEFRVVDTTNMTRGYAEQIRIVADSQVVIAEHGAFQSNVIYMRNGSLLIDLKGNYTNGENRNFENLARMFGVFYAAVLTENLTDHKSQEFNITDMDCDSIHKVTHPGHAASASLQVFHHQIMSGANASEQAEELEVLASIFPEEFKLLDGDRNFKIYLCPNPEGGDNHVAVSLVCNMPDNYPSDGPPELKIHIEKGLGANQADELAEVANRVASENIGAPSIFVVTEAVKEWLNDNNIAGQDGSMYSEMMRRMQQKDIQQKKQTEKAAIKAAADSEYTEEGPSPEELERIRKRQEGTAVTVESFNQWKKTFDAEMALLEIETLRAAGPNAQNALNALTTISVGSGTGATEDMHSPEYAAALLQAFQAGDGRPTGKQYFLLNLGAGKSAGGAGEGECEDPDAVDDGPDGMSQVAGEGYMEGDEDDDDDDSDYVDEGSDAEGDGDDSGDEDYEDDA